MHEKGNVPRLSFFILWHVMIRVSKHTNLIYECITYYIYASKLLPKVVICINIIRYTQLGIYSIF